ncbi:MAG: hypothetical protein ACRDP6_14995 [Actinoallomurus sp.]
MTAMLRVDRGRLAGLCLAGAFFGGVLSIAADAGAAVSQVNLPAGQGDGGWSGSGSGNGRHNRNSFIINSPSQSNDVQHIRNVNVGGNTVTPAAVCRRPARRCTIIQRVVVYGH